MTMPLSSELLACAVRAVQAAAAHAMAHQSRRQEAVVRTDHDVKLALDQECQAIIEGVVRASFPDHRVLGEEGDGAKEAAPGADPLWIIDPIDGTVNFSHGLPYWCHSVAVQCDGRTVAGAVFAPALGKLFTASVDQPAQCNGQPIRVSATESLRRALVLTGSERNLDQHPDATRVVTSVVAAVQKLRIFGAAALDLCMVAEGSAEVFYESGLYLWDVAAAAHIVERAGGVTEIIARLPGGRLRFLAASERLHAPFRALLQQHPAWWSPS